MKRAIIVHCWEGNPEYYWYPYVKKELEARGINVSVPAFPDTNNPRQDIWVPFLAKIIGVPDADLYLIGHSIGCATILRYLENLKVNEKVGGVLFVAGFTEDIGFEEINNFFGSPFDFAKIKSSSKNGFVSVYSDNDPFVDMRFAEIFKKELGAKTILKHNMGHFSGPINDEKSCAELPDIIENLLELSNKS
ncbi:serine hydrolase family protein [Candidatus Giovannonibacteria bacterium]|nr:serine hydrolase family protein [Candidatus Giovannonibacteria bacterium]